MGLLDNLEPPARVKTCRVRTVISGLDKADAELLRAALADEKKFSPYKLSLALNERGLDLSDDAIRRHRLKRCSC